jgi:hypothetical protein
MYKVSRKLFNEMKEKEPELAIAIFIMIVKSEYQGQLSNLIALSDKV